MELKNAVLDALYADEGGRGPDGQRVEQIASHVKREYAEALYRTVVTRKPARVLEIGMAFGATSLAILTALREAGGGRLTSIDPLQFSLYKGQGAAAVERAGLADLHRMMPDYDYRAMPQLLLDGEEFDLIYIDGWHTFDYTLVDLFFADKMLVEGGVIGINDGGMPAVHNALLGFLAHRDFVEIDVGLPPAYDSEDAKRADRNYADRYFEKRMTFEPTWDYFADFWIAPGDNAPRQVSAVEARARRLAKRVLPASLVKSAQRRLAG